MHLNTQHYPESSLSCLDLPRSRARNAAASQFPELFSECLRRGHAKASIRERAQTFVQAADLLDPFFGEPPVMDDKAVKKSLVAAAGPRLRALHALSKNRPAGCAESRSSDLGVAPRRHRPARTRCAHRRTASPSLFEVLDLLGRDVALARLSRAADLAEAT